MNITFAVADDVVKRARKAAIDRDTTLTAMLREHVHHIAESAATDEAERKRQQLEALERSFEECKSFLGPRTWTRADLHDRSQK